MFTVSCSPDMHHCEGPGSNFLVTKVASSEQVPFLLHVCMGYMLQPPLGIPLLNSLHFVNVLLLLGVQVLKAVDVLWSNKFWVDGDNHFPQHTGYSSANTTQDTASVFSCQGTLLAHVQLTVYQHTQVIFSRAAPQPVNSQPVLLPGIILFQVQNFAFVLVEFYKVPVVPFLQPAEVSLNGSPALQLIYWCPQFDDICKLLSMPPLPSCYWIRC